MTEVTYLTSMKHFLTTWSALLLGVFAVLMPVQIFATNNFYVTVLSPTYTSTDFTANYQFTTSPPRNISLYAWVGDVSSTTFDTWDRNNYVGNFATTSSLPFSISKTFNFADHNLVAGKTYGYALADGTGTDATLFNSVGASSLYNCFTVTDGPVSCPTGGAGNGGNNSQTQGVSVDLSATGQAASEAAGQYIESFDITPTSPLSSSAQVSLKTFDLNESLVSTTPVTLPVGSQTTSPSVDNLQLGSYTAYVVASDGTTKISQTVSFIITGSGTQGTNQSNNNTGGTAAVCGPSNNGTFATVPDTGTLCLSGFVYDNFGTTTTGWSWICDGQNGGANSGLCTATSSTAANNGQPTNYPKSYFQNPFKNLDTFPKIFKAVYDGIIMPIAIPFIAIFIMYSGFLFVIARKSGNTRDLDKAKKTLTYTLIGAALLLGGWVITYALQGTLNAITQ
jgi:hypothetical protein